VKTSNEIPLKKPEVLLKTYNGENITPVGVLKTNVEYNCQQSLLLDIYVVKGKGPVLMGEGLALQDTLRLACHQITEC